MSGELVCSWISELLSSGSQAEALLTELLCLTDVCPQMILQLYEMFVGCLNRSELDLQNWLHFQLLLLSRGNMYDLD